MVSRVPFARPAIRRLGARVFTLDDRTFDAVHYAGVAACTVLALVFDVAPLVALAIMRARGG